MPSNELVLAGGGDEWRQAQEAATGMSIGQMHLAARAAGLTDWLFLVPDYKMSAIGSKTSEALRMPFPSPATQAWRVEAGFGSGVKTADDSSWSLCINDSVGGAGGHDTGVQLVVCKQNPNTREHKLRFPLDIIVPDYSLLEAQVRPDRVSVVVGDRQLPSGESLFNEPAQRLLIVISNFLRILGNGEAAELQPPPQSRSRLRRALGRG